MASDISHEWSKYYGTWKIVECVSLTGTVESTGIEGTEFTLEEDGDVSWKVSQDAEPMPFFTCETYEITPAALGCPGLLKFHGQFPGNHAIEFRLEISDDFMLLTYERCCMLQCQKISSIDSCDKRPYSLLEALTEGYFSDISVTAASGKEFHVHKTVLKLSAPEVDWNSTPMPLTGLPEDVLSAILHFLYSECLPPGLSEETARSCCKLVGKLPGFAKFSQICETFLKNTALKQQIISLVTDMHACADKVIDLFSGQGDGKPCRHDDENLGNNPARLCYVVKQALRECALASAKLLILCELFARRKGELSKQERHDILKYAKSRLPVFMNQLHKFLEVCGQHSASLSPGQRHDIATYLVPEIESSLDMLSRFITDIKSALEQVINSSSEAEKGDKSERSEKPKKAHKGGMLGKTLKNALHMRELRKLRTFHNKTTGVFTLLIHKKENFSLMTHEEKVRSVAKNLEQLIDEVPLFLIRLEELMAALEEKVTWKEWKYLFKLGTGKVAWCLGKVTLHRNTLKSLIRQTCDIVHRDQFNASLTSLGLIDAAELSQDTELNSPTINCVQTSPCLCHSLTNCSNNISGVPSNSKSVPSSASFSHTRYAQLSSVESLCTPPPSKDSCTAQRALDLLNNLEKADMVFEIVTATELGDVVIDHSSGTPVAVAQPETEEVCHMGAHCVIIAARCDWFRRALLSGMRESIDKKITVHDSNPALFRLFLQYLYSGQLDIAELTTEQIADLMTLGDRYELDSLKSLCEAVLKRHLSDDSALFLLSLADQLNAKQLKEWSLRYLIEHPGLIESDVFDDLPQQLQTTVEDAVTWHGLETRTRQLSGHSHTETPSSVSSVSEIDEILNNVDLDEHVQRELSTSSSSDEMCLTEDSDRLESCVEELRHIVGDSVPREELVGVSLAADYDINRALNYFFSF